MTRYLTMDELLVREHPVENDVRRSHDDFLLTEPPVRLIHPLDARFGSALHHPDVVLERGWAMLHGFYQVQVNDVWSSGCLCAIDLREGSCECRRNRLMEHGQLWVELDERQFADGLTDAEYFVRPVVTWMPDIERSRNAEMDLDRYAAAHGMEAVWYDHSWYKDTGLIELRVDDNQFRALERAVSRRIMRVSTGRVTPSFARYVASFGTTRIPDVGMAHGSKLYGLVRELSLGDVDRPFEKLATELARDDNFSHLSLYGQSLVVEFLRHAREHVITYGSWV